MTVSLLHCLVCADHGDCLKQTVLLIPMDEGLGWLIVVDPNERNYCNESSSNHQVIRFEYRRQPHDVTTRINKELQFIYSNPESILHSLILLCCEYNSDHIADKINGQAKSYCN